MEQKIKELEARIKYLEDMILGKTEILGGEMHVYCLSEEDRKRHISSLMKNDSRHTE